MLDINPEDLLPAPPPSLPLPRFLVGRTFRQVTVPYPGWACSLCRVLIKTGEKAVKAGKVIICAECIRKGK